jgi:hypothetical protein
MRLGATKEGKRGVKVVGPSVASLRSKAERRAVGLMMNMDFDGEMLLGHTARGRHVWMGNRGGITVRAYPR